MIDILPGTQKEGVPVLLWAPEQEIEWEAKNQLYNVSKLPWAFHHVAVMPDCHYGKGCTVGSVIAMKGAVSPASVGVDIGCGMGAIKTSLKADDLPDNLKNLRYDIEQAIPVGFSSHPELVKLDSWGDRAKLMNDVKVLLATFKLLHPRVQDLSQRAAAQIGTLGGGNHFIELCLDTDGGVWMMLHSGSRNIGKSLAEIHIAEARKLSHNQALPDRDLAVFLSGTPEMEAYRRDLFWAQEYAFLNRRMMFELYKDVMRQRFPKIEFGAPILCHHNYVSEETHFGEDVVVTRKGAIRAGKGEMGIIPGSMGTRSYIVAGLGSPESFCSASHGAGRRMSRGKAKKRFSVDDLRQQTEGVECRKDEGVLDEIPGAYKDIEQVMRNQADLVRVVHELKQLLVVKG